MNICKFKISDIIKDSLKNNYIKRVGAKKNGKWVINKTYERK